MPPSEKEKKQVVKLHKDFLDEIEGCNLLERQGQQGFSSLVNIAERLPSLTSDKSKLGILNSMDRIHVLMQRRHFEALEKTSTYISQVIQNFFDRVENMQRAMATCNDVFARITLEEGNMFLVELMEWMENVLSMYEREAARKKQLGQGLEYANLADLQTRYGQWMSSSVHGYIKANYVSTVVDAMAKQRA
ncbi:hypothetical protein AC1031_004570 [Aphanomyces cochlioides]|nr:hypothetical protein AC1031_004570 [Aphanomyces cochlioides]